MKQVLEQYASTIIAALSALMLFVTINQTIFSNEMGISEVLGAILEYSIGNKSMAEDDAMDDFLQESTLVLEEKKVYLVQNQLTTVADCYVVKDAQEQEVSVYVKKIWRVDETPIDLEISEDGKKIRIPQAGIYWVELAAMDKNGREQSWVAKLLVNER